MRDAAGRCGYTVMQAYDMQREADIPAGNSQVQAVKNDKSVHASAAGPWAVQGWRHQFEEYCHSMNGMQRTQNLQRHCSLSVCGVQCMQDLQLPCIVSWTVKVRQLALGSLRSATWCCM